MAPIRVLFICQHNNAHSQIAATYLHHLGKDRFEVKSAGLKPTVINPLVIETMQEEGFNISTNQTTNVFDLWRAGELFQYAITVCSTDIKKLCPVFPRTTECLHWPFPDSETITGSREEKQAAIRSIRDDIKTKIIRFLNQHG